MAKIRVYALAKELEIDSQRVIDLARELGADVARPSNALDDTLANQIREMQASMTAAEPERQPEPEIESESEAEEPADLSERVSEESSVALETPTEEPRFAGFTKHGRPISLVTLRITLAGSLRH